MFSRTSMVRSSGPATSTRTASSPNCWWKRSVAFAASEDPPMSELVESLACRPSAATNPPAASAATTQMVAIGRAVTTATIRVKILPTRSNAIQSRARSALRRSLHLRVLARLADEVAEWCLLDARRRGAAAQRVRLHQVAQLVGEQRSHGGRKLHDRSQG